MHIKTLPSLETSLPSLHSQKMKLLLYFLLFITVSSHSVSTSSSHNLSLRRQASILVTLKQSFQTTNASFDSWNLSSHTLLCAWQGVQCDDTRSSLIVSLDISNSNISGYLSPAITQLRSLASLDVSGNEFVGEFPAGIHALARLKHLNLSNNLFAGEMSWEFSELRELRTLDAYNNNFNGSLPRDLAGLSKLRYLSLGGNFFSGEIPRSYGLMSGLEYLSLAGNDLGGAIPSELGNLTRLKQLYLGYYNSFNGGIPAEFGKLLNLFHLDIANCSLRGPIPPELGNLRKLDTLFLQTNELNGSLSARLGNLSSLKSLDLSNNELSGEIPEEFSGLKELTLLNLFINKFHGEIPRAIAELPKLEVLKLWQNNFTGTIPPRLGQNRMLAELDLSTNKLTGKIPESLCSGGKLKILILLNNFLFGPLPEDLGRCDTLVRVRMGHNYLAGDLPRGFLYLPELLLLELHNNYLTGELEQSSTTKVASKLSQINLSNNRLSGSIPGSLGDFSSLQIVLLNGNGFTDSIPSEIGGLKRLLKADLSKNRLSGQIPSSISNCLILTYLDLSQNQISGEIPTRIAEIHNLNYLNISWNNLTGAPPREIGSMKSLTAADFSHNNLSGTVPQTGQYSFFNSTSFAGNPYLCISPDCNNTTNNNSSSASPKNGSQTNDSLDHNHHRVPAKYKLIFALGLLLCSLLFAAFAIARSRRNKGSAAGPWKLTAFQKLGFSSQDVVECVKDGNVIGRGGAGVVYGGIMGVNGERVAVKKLLGINNNKISSSHHDNGLKAEIQTLGKIRHRNIVRLLAFCSDGETNLLVYEYMENGSLGEVLHGKAGGSLKWETRLDIAVEAAKGISYLHHDCSPLILHRDVKSNNILLDSSFEAHVADFGLAKFLHDTGNSECMSAIAGSYGYIAPEYAYTLKVDEKSDVYSFGVVLLELITGKRPVGDFGEEGLDIVQWAKMKSESVKEGVAKILDERLFNDVPIEQAMQVFFVAMLCVQEQSIERPTMREVVQMLAQAKQPSTFHMQ